MKPFSFPYDDIVNEINTILPRLDDCESHDNLDIILNFKIKIYSYKFWTKNCEAGSRKISVIFH